MTAMMLSVGYTGTRFGMAPPQLDAVWQLLDGMPKTVQIRAHHGLCQGGDAQFHALAKRRGAWIVGHPGPDGDEHRMVLDCDEMRPPAAHLRRNANIVGEVSIMIGAPLEATPQERGGTWWTIKHSQKKQRPLALVEPTGRIVFHYDFERMVKG